MKREEGLFLVRRMQKYLHIFDLLVLFCHDAAEKMIYFMHLILQNLEVIGIIHIFAAKERKTI